MMQEFSELFGHSLWLMEPTAMRGLLARAQAATPDAVQAAMKAYADSPQLPSVTLVGDVAVICMSGPIVYRSSWMSMYFGLATIESMRAQFRAALNDPVVRQIVWRCSSPGGAVEMVPEFADEIYAAKGQGKPITFVADTMICSCAYWLASQGDQIVATRSSMLGAIGTFVRHEDISEMLAKAGIKITTIKHGDHKDEGNPYEPLSDEARAELQAYADEIGTEFETAVARGRGVTKKVVLETFGQGRIIRGKKAVDLGMASKMGTFDAVLGKMSKPRGARAAADVAPVTDDTQPPVAVAEGKGKASVCATCGKSSCPCAAAECPEDCQTCDPDCPCVKPAEEDDDVAAKAKAAAARRADADLTSTTVAVTGSVLP